MNTLLGMLILVAVLVISLGSFTPGTTGIAQIAIACFLAILARIVQAAKQHAELMDALGGQQDPKPRGQRPPESERQPKVRVY